MALLLKPEIDKEFGYFDKEGRTITPPRSLKIIQHYQNEIDKGRMSLNWAFERCAGDIEGRNWHPDLPQKGKSHYRVTVNVESGR